jgi:plasmid stabilization system protein ParE
VELKWTSKALSDLTRLHEFLEPMNAEVAARTVRSLSRAAHDLLAHPRIGRRLAEFEPREVRHIMVGRYELRYEIQETTLYILRLWHMREDR